MFHLLRSLIDIPTDGVCPKCGAFLRYNPVSKTVYCPYCGFSQKVDVRNGEEIRFSEYRNSKNGEDKNGKAGS